VSVQECKLHGLDRRCTGTCAGSNPAHRAFRACVHVQLMELISEHGVHKGVWFHSQLARRVQLGEGTLLMLMLPDVCCMQCMSPAACGCDSLLMVTQSRGLRLVTQPIQPTPSNAAGLTCQCKRGRRWRTCGTAALSETCCQVRSQQTKLRLHCTWVKTCYRRCDHTLAGLEAGGGRAVAALLLRAAQLPCDDMAADMCLDACWEKLHTGSWSEVTPGRACVRRTACNFVSRALALAPKGNQMLAVQVSVMWRNVYTAASLLCAYGMAGLAPAQPAQPMAQQADGMPEKAHGRTTSDRGVAIPDGSVAVADSSVAISAAAATRALRQLDMATLLGGPLFRPQLDACIGSLQTGVAADCHRPPSPGVCG
jgi:hypothetical protein